MTRYPLTSWIACSIRSAVVTPFFFMRLDTSPIQSLTRQVLPALHDWSVNVLPGISSMGPKRATPFGYDGDSEVPRSVSRRRPRTTGGRIHAPHRWGSPGPCAGHGGGGGRGRRTGQAAAYAGTAVPGAAQGVQRRLPGVCQGLRRGEDAGGTAGGRPEPVPLARQVRLEVPGVGRAAPQGARRRGGPGLDHDQRVPAAAVQALV